MTETKYLLDDEPLYLCDPKKNTKCTKESCFLNGGPCDKTKDINMASDIIPVDAFAPTREVSI